MPISTPASHRTSPCTRPKPESIYCVKVPKEPVDDARAAHRDYRGSGAGESLKKRRRLSAQVAWQATSFSAAMPSAWQRAIAAANGSGRDDAEDVGKDGDAPWR